MRTISYIAVLIILPSVVFSQELVTADSLIEKNGGVIIKEGGCLYVFHKDRTFEMVPDGLSGQTIRGSWKREGPVFNIEGVWGWVNGISEPGDRRRMRLYLNVVDQCDRQTRRFYSSPLPENALTCRAYMFVDELVKVPK